MRFLIKLLISVCILVVCYWIVGKYQRATLAGLITVMPLTSLIFLIWLYVDYPGDFNLMADYTKGALWGIVPTILFFLVAFICFRKHLSLWLVLCAGFSVWFVAAFIHQWLLNK
jgi:uncharacterized membrane protein (GlpM family)